ncbi:hypothetical protein ACOZE4_18385 [Streptomyces griseoincarnatus]
MTHRLCGTPHHKYPQTLCTEPTGHYVRDRDPHAGPLIIDGRERGGASWDEPQPPVVSLPSAGDRPDGIREQLLHAIDHAYVSGVLGYTTPEDLLAAYDNSRTPPATEPVGRTALREQIDEVLVTTRRTDYEGKADHRQHQYDARCALCAGDVDALTEALTSAVLRRMADAGPLSPYYEHPECGFHWHGRDGMDIPMRDGQPVCPRCELAKVQKRLDYTQRRRDEVGVECKRRGKRVLEQSERITALERQVDEVQRQLGAEILRAGQAEAELRRMADETATETPQPSMRERHRAAWHALTPDEQAARIAELDAIHESAAGARQDEPVVTVHTAPDLSPAAEEALGALVDVAKRQAVCDFEHPHPEHPCGRRTADGAPRQDGGQP